jgi:hypothetical protein
MAAFILANSPLDISYRGDRTHIGRLDLDCK